MAPHSLEGAGALRHRRDYHHIPDVRSLRDPDEQSMYLAQMSGCFIDATIAGAKAKIPAKKIYLSTEDPTLITEVNAHLKKTHEDYWYVVAEKPERGLEKGFWYELVKHG